MKLKLLFLTLMSFLLFACGPVYHTTYQYIPPSTQTRKMCIRQCIHMKQVCQLQNRLQTTQCRTVAMQEAGFQYQAYIYGQEQQNLPLMRTYNDFYYPYYCQKVYNCHADFNQCYVTCGGQLNSHTQCVAFCGKSNSH